VTAARDATTGLTCHSSPRRVYFGVVLDEMDAVEFFLANAPKHSPGDFAKAYPWMVPLIEKVLVAYGYAVKLVAGE
jgi:hypothetical protein